MDLRVFIKIDVLNIVLILFFGMDYISLVFFILVLICLNFLYDFLILFISFWMFFEVFKGFGFVFLENLLVLSLFIIVLILINYVIFLGFLWILFVISDEISCNFFIWEEFKFNVCGYFFYYFYFCFFVFKINFWCYKIIIEIWI